MSYKTLRQIKQLINQRLFYLPFIWNKNARKKYKSTVNYMIKCKIKLAYIIFKIQHKFYVISLEYLISMIIICLLLILAINH